MDFFDAGVSRCENRKGSNGGGDSGRGVDGMLQERVMTSALVCWKCGTPLSDQPLPLGRTAECAKCRADLHVCRMCEYFDPRVALSCRETVADEVKVKERANFCGYFTVAPDAYSGGGGETSRVTRAQLDALFGDDGGKGKAEDDNAKAASRSEADIARERLEQLFGSGKKGDI
jgi:hypothetical protein